MPKILVKPAEPMMLMLDGGENMEPCRPSVVTNQSYLTTFIASGKVNILLPDLPDEVTDADFLKHYSASRGEDGPDEKKAIAAFKAEVPKLVKARRGEEEAEEKTTEKK